MTHFKCFISTNYHSLSTLYSSIRSTRFSNFNPMLVIQWNKTWYGTILHGILPHLSKDGNTIVRIWMFKMNLAFCIIIWTSKRGLYLWQHNSENLDVQDEIGVFVPSFELQNEACTEWLLLLWWGFLDKTVDERTVLRELGQSFDTCWIRSLTDMALAIYVTVPWWRSCTAVEYRRKLCKHSQNNLYLSLWLPLFSHKSTICQYLPFLKLHVNARQVLSQLLSG